MILFCEREYFDELFEFTIFMKYLGKIIHSSKAKIFKDFRIKLCNNLFSSFYLLRRALL